MSTYTVEIKIKHNPGGAWTLFYFNANVSSHQAADQKYQEKMDEAKSLLPANVTGSIAINEDHEMVKIYSVESLLLHLPDGIPGLEDLDAYQGDWGRSSWVLFEDVKELLEKAQWFALLDNGPAWLTVRRSQITPLAAWEK